MKIIKEANVCYDIILCGTGATGSQLLPFLSQLLAYSEGNTLTIIDEDRIELKNCKNQKFLPDDETKYKAEVLCKRYKTVYPKLDISYVPEFIKTPGQLVGFVKQSRTPAKRVLVLVGCVDNNPTRKVFGEFYHNYNGNMIYIDSGNGTVDRIGQIVVSAKIKNYYPSNKECEEIVDTPCPYDLFEEIATDTDTVDKATSCGYNTDSNPQNIATNVMAASTLFSVLTNIIQFNEVNPGVIYFDAEKPGIVFRPFPTSDKKDNGTADLPKES